MEFHEIANIFRLLIGDEYRQLEESIADGWLQEYPIVLFENKILDGRNRYIACQKLKIEPNYIEYTGNNPLSFVIKSNLNRRHLSKEERIEIMRLMRSEGATYQEIADAADVSRDTAWRKTKDVELSDFGKVKGKDDKYYPPSYKPKELSLNNPALYSSNTPEWYTPKSIINMVIQVMGEITLDPCSNEGTPNVPAKNHFTIKDDGLSKEWLGKVYMNPPYGNKIEKWINKIVREYYKMNIEEAIILVPSRTDTVWFRNLKEFPRCFIWGRLKFSGQDNPATFPSMAVYMGNNQEAFINVFNKIGDIYSLV